MSKNIENDRIILDASKVLWHQERINEWLEGKKIAPITIDMSLSSLCTYKCEYCYGQMQCMGNGNLPRDIIIQFLDDAAELGVKGISFMSDGESTCNPHLLEAVNYGKAQGIDMALATNGYLLKDEELPALLPDLTWLRFNISSATEQGYSKIHGVHKKCYYKVLNTIKEAIRIKKVNNLSVTIGMQMVLMPQYKDEIMPLVELGKELHVDYLVIKHCSDDEDGTLGVDYSKYHELIEILKDAEQHSTDSYLVKAKWSKILSDGKRSYSKCYGPSFILQLSGSGLVAPCGMFFNKKYEKYHIGSLYANTFKEIWNSQKYDDVLQLIRSDCFNAHSDCGTLCIHHKTNEVLDSICKQSSYERRSLAVPEHINFI